MPIIAILYNFLYLPLDGFISLSFFTHINYTNIFYNLFSPTLNIIFIALSG